jgi:hypothetical protein
MVEGIGLEMKEAIRHVVEGHSNLVKLFSQTIENLVQAPPMREIVVG